MDTPGHYYPLFFHDEAVALAAGHRPCGQCRPNALSAFLEAWKIGHDYGEYYLNISQLDRECHRARVNERSTRLSGNLNNMPDGSFILVPEINSRPLLVCSGHLWPWQHGGYGEPIAKQRATNSCIQLTPAPIIAVLRAGYLAIVAGDLQRVATIFG